MSGFRISQCYSDPEEKEDFHIKKEQDEDEDEEEDEDEWEEEPPPEKLLLGHSSAETTAPTAAMYPSNRTTFLANQFAWFYKVPTELDLRAPNSDQRAHNPPAGYAGIYSDYFKCGLRLPLPPFVVSILAHYRIALAQLHPNGIHKIVGFIKKCEGLSVVPTTGLFRHFFQFGRSRNSRGWYTFFLKKKQHKIVHGQPSQVIGTIGWKKAFYFFKISENVSLCWNHSPSMNPSLAEDEMPSEETVSLLMASSEESSSKRKYADEDTSMELRQKRPSESPANEPAKEIPGLEEMTTEQFARSIQKSVSSFFNLQLQGEKEKLQKVVEAKEHDIKDRENEIASLKGDNKELEKEIASLKSKLKSVGEDRGPLLKVYTYKLLKTKGFSRFFEELTKSAQRLGRHLAAKKIQERCPSIPTKAFAGVEDFLAESKLDNLFYSMVQDEAFVFPLLDHLLSVEEIPSSSELQLLNVDEDENAVIPPPPVPRTQSNK